MDFSTIDLGFDMAIDALSLDNEMNNVDNEFFKSLESEFSDHLPVSRIHDPSDPMKFLFEKKFEAMVDGEVVKTDRRNVNQKAPVRSCLSQSDRKRFSADMFVDNMTLPTINSIEGDEVLNMSMISRELLQDFRGLSTIVVSRATLAASVSFGYFEAFGTKIDDSADIFVRNSMVTHLVGHVIPIFGQTRAAPATGFGPKSQMLANHSKLEEGHQEATSKARSINHSRANVSLVRPPLLGRCCGLHAGGWRPTRGSGARATRCRCHTLRRVLRTH
jgi:hypothetical protein